jgi:hypothetical protein
MAIALLTLALVATLAFGGTMALGYAGGEVRRHVVAALATTTLLVMAHSFIMFFLIATGVSIKELEKERAWGDSFRKRTLVLKGRVFPVLTLALLLVMANFILGAAAHTRVIPAWAHGALAWITLAVSTLALARSYRVLGENNRLIAEAGARVRADQG